MGTLWTFQMLISVPGLEKVLYLPQWRSMLFQPQGGAWLGLGGGAEEDQVAARLAHRLPISLPAGERAPQSDSADRPAAGDQLDEGKQVHRPAHRGGQELHRVLPDASLRGPRWSWTVALSLSGLWQVILPICRKKCRKLWLYQVPEEQRRKQCIAEREVPQRAPLLWPGWDPRRWQEQLQQQPGLALTVFSFHPAFLPGAAPGHRWLQLEEQAEPVGEQAGHQRGGRGAEIHQLHLHRIPGKRPDIPWCCHL